MKAKMIKWGYKIWKLCDSSSGYTLNLGCLHRRKRRKKRKRIGIRCCHESGGSVLWQKSCGGRGQLFYKCPFILGFTYQIHLRLWNNSIKSKVFARGVREARRYGTLFGNPEIWWRLSGRIRNQFDFWAHAANQKELTQWNDEEEVKLQRFFHARPLWSCTPSTWVVLIGQTEWYELIPSLVEARNAGTASSII